MKYRKSILILVFIPLGILAAVGFNLLLDKLIYPNPCIYHTKEAPSHLFFTLFYEVSSDTGGHPEATLFNRAFTFTIGAILGYVIALKGYRKLSITNKINLHPI